MRDLTLIIAGSVCVLAAAAAAPAEVSRVPAPGVLAVHSDPASGSPAVTTVAQGEQVEVIVCPGGAGAAWCQIRTPPRSGWVAGENLRPSDGGFSVQDEWRWDTSTPYTVAGAGERPIALHRSPGGSRTTLLPAGAEIALTDCRERAGVLWCHTMLPPRVGWIESRFLSAPSPPASDEAAIPVPRELSQQALPDPPPPVRPKPKPESLTARAGTAPEAESQFTDSNPPEVAPPPLQAAEPLPAQAPQTDVTCDNPGSDPKAAYDACLTVLLGISEPARQRETLEHMVALAFALYRESGDALFLSRAADHEVQLFRLLGPKPARHPDPALFQALVETSGCAGALAYADRQMGENGLRAALLGSENADALGTCLFELGRTGDGLVWYAELQALTGAPTVHFYRAQLAHAAREADWLRRWSGGLIAGAYAREIADEATRYLEQANPDRPWRRQLAHFYRAEAYLDAGFREAARLDLEAAKRLGSGESRVAADAIDARLRATQTP